MNRLIIPLLGATVLLGGCHNATVRTTVEVPLRVVEHRHLHQGVVILHGHEYDGHEHNHHPSTYSYSSRRVVVVNPPPVVHQTRVTVDYHEGGHHRGEGSGHRPAPPVVVHRRHDDGRPGRHTDNGHRSHGNASGGHPPAPDHRQRDHDNRSSHSQGRGHSGPTTTPPSSRGDGDGAHRAESPRANARRPTHPRGDTTAPQTSREHVAEARRERPAPATKGSGKQEREKKAAERDEKQEEENKGRWR